MVLPYGRSKKGTRVIKKTNIYPFIRYNLLCAISANKVVGCALYEKLKGFFICIKKSEAISDLVYERLGDIKEIYEELSTTNKLDANTTKLINEFLDKISIADSFKDNDGITYPNFKSYNEHKVKILIYNNSDKINNDLTIIFDTLPSIE